MPTFRGIGHLAAEGCLVKPLFHQWVLDDSIPIEFTLRVTRPTPRPYDGFFHASSHPLMTHRELYRYMAQEPGAPGRDDFGYEGRLSVMFGSLSHAVIEAFLDYMGVAVPLPPGDCPACGRPRRPVRAARDPAKYCSEHGAIDLETRSRCHLDSILDFKARGTFGFDFKSIHQFGLKKVPDMDTQAFYAKWPHYWAQMQECMRLTGLRKYIVFFLTLGFPWDTREFHFDYDPLFAEQTRAKYLQVINHVERGVEILI